jgi:hypothetical protein
MRVSIDPQDVGYNPHLMAALVVYCGGQRVRRPITADSFQQVVVQEASYPDGQPMLQKGPDGTRVPVRRTIHGPVVFCRKDNGTPWPHVEVIQEFARS